jgi:ribonuclease D
VSSDGPPPVQRWAERDPDAAARLARSREVLGAVAAERSMPVENLLEPALARRLAWRPPALPVAVGDVETALAAGGARPWQIALTAAPLASALAATATDSPVRPEA